jgi:putative ABC transport system permease protein
MNNKPHTVVGVLPDYPQYPRENDVYMSTSACPFRSAAEANQATIGHRAFGALQVFGRLAADSNLERASTEIATVAQSFERDHPQIHQRARLLGFTGQAAFLEEELIENARTLVWALTGVTVLVLLIACANVANLAMARTFRRGRELAVRTALGAGRGRLVRQLMTESIIVAAAGAVLGLGLAWLTLDLLGTFVGRFTPRTAGIQIDGVVLVFAAVAAIATGLAFGLAPVLVTRQSLAQAMRDGTAGAGEAAGRSRVRSGLVVAQVAVAFALLVGAALLLESFYKLSRVPLGFSADRVMTAAIFGNFSRQNVGNIENAILERLRSSPGVRAAALTTAVPQQSTRPGNLPVITIEGRPAEGAGELTADAQVVSDQYFDALNVTLRAGRDFRPTDVPVTAGGNRVAIINSSMATMWKGADPIGQRFSTPGFGAPAGQSAAFTVIGIAPDFRLYRVDEEVAAQFYVALSQFPGAGARMLVRADSDPATVAQIMKQAVHSTDATTPVEEISTLAEIRNDTQLAEPAMTAGLLTLFAAIALFVTLTGIAGIIGTSVSQRTREFGLRMALGASRGSVLRLVLGHGAGLVAAGVVLGIAGAYWFTRLIDSFLFATTATDPLAYGAVAIIFLLAALIAAFGPARRATSIDPLIALKTD